MEEAWSLARRREAALARRRLINRAMVSPRALSEGERRQLDPRDAGLVDHLLAMTPDERVRWAHQETERLRNLYTHQPVVLAALSPDDGLASSGPLARDAATSQRDRQRAAASLRPLRRHPRPRQPVDQAQLRQEIADLATYGASRTEIADVLEMSEAIIRNDLATLYQQAGVHSVVAFAARHRAACRVTGHCISPELVRALREIRGPEGVRLDLTPAQAEVMRLAVQGLEVPEMAGALGINMAAVHARLGAIYARLGAHSLVDAVRIYLDEQPSREDVA